MGNGDFHLKKKLFFFSLIFSFLIFSSCSQVLSLAFSPVETLLAPSIIVDADGAKVFYSMSKETTYDYLNPENTYQDFAFYVWRSTVSPYSGYDLLGKIYMKDLAIVYTGQDASGQEVNYDFTVQEDDLTYEYQQDSFLLDKKALEEVCYYRITKVTLCRSYKKNSMIFTLSYYLDSKTSSWASSRGAHE